MKLAKPSFVFMGSVLLGAWPLMAAPAGSSQISLKVGAEIPTWANHLDNSQSVGPVGGARYLYQLTSNLGVGGQFDFFHLPGKTQDVSGLDENPVDNIYTGELVGKYSFMPDAAWAPYVNVGIGVARTFQTVRGTPTDGNSWNDTGTTETRIVDHESSTNYALSYGGGVEHMLTSHLMMAAEANWNTFGASSTKIGSSTLNFPDVSLRLGWQFGGK